MQVLTLSTTWHFHSTSETLQTPKYRFNKEHTATEDDQEERGRAFLREATGGHGPHHHYHLLNHGEFIPAVQSRGTLTASIPSDSTKKWSFTTWGH